MNATMLYVSNEGRSRRSDLIVEILDTIGISYTSPLRFFWGAHKKFDM